MSLLKRRTRTWIRPPSADRSQASMLVAGTAVDIRERRPDLACCAARRRSNFDLLRVDPPDSRHFGGDAGHSNILTVYLCGQHNNPKDAAALRTELIDQARRSELTVPDPI